MPPDPSSSTQLSGFYGEMSSLERILASLARDGVDVERLQARDLYERDLDCQNLGAHGALVAHADEVARHAVPGAGDRVVDVGCGLGGPGRFLAERFGCSVLGVDLLPLRIEVAAALTERSGLAQRITYRVADATRLPAEDGAFAQAWMLDVSIHVRDKRALFTEVARVLRPGGLLVMHDQTGPLPRAMAPVTREAPFIAPSLPQLVRYVEAARFRLLSWQDTTARILDYWRQVRAAHLGRMAGVPEDEVPVWRRRMLAMTEAYIETLDRLDGRTGLLVARRAGAGPPPPP